MPRLMVLQPLNTGCSSMAQKSSTKCIQLKQGWAPFMFRPAANHVMPATAADIYSRYLLGSDNPIQQEINISIWVHRNCKIMQSHSTRVSKFQPVQQFQN